MKIQQLINKKKREKKAKAIKQTALTAALGLTAGATAGILFAPKSGKETRETIAAKTVEAKERVSEKTSSAKAALNIKVEEGKKNVSEAKGKIAAYLAEKRGSQVEENPEVEETVEENVETVETAEETTEA